MDTRMKGILMTPAILLASCSLLLAPPPLIIRGPEGVTPHVCGPLLTRYLDPVPPEMDDALRNAIVYWSILLGVTPFIQITVLESEEYDYLIRKYDVAVWITIVNSRAPWAETIAYVDSTGCVTGAMVQISRYAIDAGQDEVQGLLGHELGALLGAPEPESRSDGDLQILRDTTEGLPPMPWQPVPTLTDWLMIQQILQQGAIDEKN